MEKMQVYGFEASKGSKICSLKRLLCRIVVFLMLCLIVVFAIYLSILDQKIASIKNEQINLSRRMNSASIIQYKRVNDTASALRRLTEEQLADIEEKIDQLRQGRIGNNSAPSKTKSEISQNLRKVREHLDILISTVANLRFDVSTMNISSKSKMSRLRSDLNNFGNQLILLRSELTQLNYTLQNDIAHISNSIVSAVEDLREEIYTLRNSTSIKHDELWKDWNKTNQELDDVVKLISQQNESLHFKLAYHSDALYSEVKNVERKQLSFHNYTVRAINNLRSQLNHTRYSMKNLLTHELSLVNASLHSTINDMAKSLRSSIKQIRVEVDRVKNDIQKDVDKILKAQQEMKAQISKTKAEFQEKNRKYDKDVSGQVSRMNSQEKRMKDLEGKLDSKERKIARLEQDLGNLQDTVDQIKNKANGVLKANVSFFFFSLFMSCTVIAFQYF